MNNLFFPEFVFRNFIGADHIQRLSDRVQEIGNTTNFPPYNIEQVDEDSYVLSVALAGYSPDEINVTVHDNTLTIQTEETEEKKEDDRVFLYRGISKRKFKRQLVLGDYIQVGKAEMKNGLLTIILDRVVPEAAKPKRIEIQSGLAVIEGKPVEHKLKVNG